MILVLQLKQQVKKKLMNLKTFINGILYGQNFIIIKKILGTYIAYFILYQQL